LNDEPRIRGDFRFWPENEEDVEEKHIFYLFTQPEPALNQCGNGREIWRCEKNG
jgi:hypothetical protein